ncbi:hypothetical protein [Bacillus sp. OV322]|uniref:hypothetical protein n=1 Tax=Bacillus sp. OV322 TaxID=1882764 RepID=UPI00114D4885|nr:hypothetical protein [Bacillus sp. OV322]
MGKKLFTAVDNTLVRWKERMRMLVAGYYFLKERERFQKERAVLDSMTGMTESEVAVMDDRELMEIYQSCKELVTA